MSGGTAAGEPMVSTLLPYMYPWGCGSGMALEVGAGNSVSLGTVNLSNPRAIFAVSPPRFTRSRVPYEAYVVRRTSTRPQVDSARASAATSPPSPTVARWSWRSRAAPASAYRAAAGSAPAHTPPDRPCPDPAPPPAPPPDRHSRHADLGGRAAELGADPRLPLPHEICWYTYILACFRDAAHVVWLTSWPFGRNIPKPIGTTHELRYRPRRAIRVLVATATPARRLLPG